MVNLFAKMRVSIAAAANLDASGAASVTITSMTSVKGGVTTTLACNSSAAVNKGSPKSRLLQQRLPQQQLPQQPRHLQAADSTTYTYTLVANSNTAAALQSSMASTATAQVALGGVLQAYANALETAKVSSLFTPVAPAEVVAASLTDVLSGFAAPVLTVSSPSTSPTVSPSPSPQPGSAQLSITVQLDNFPSTFVVSGALTSAGLSAIRNAIASSVSASCPACTTSVTQVRDATSGARLWGSARQLQTTVSLLVDYTVSGTSLAAITPVACSASAASAISSALQSNPALSGVKATQVSGCSSSSSSGSGFAQLLAGGPVAGVVIACIVGFIAFSFIYYRCVCRQPQPPKEAASTPGLTVRTSEPSQGVALEVTDDKSTSAGKSDKHADLL
jgi:hypothetical protein